jgi:hypothetical protein
MFSNMTDRMSSCLYLVPWYFNKNNRMHTWGWKKYHCTVVPGTVQNSNYQISHVTTHVSMHPKNALQAVLLAI